LDKKNNMTISHTVDLHATTNLDKIKVVHYVVYCLEKLDFDGSFIFLQSTGNRQRVRDMLTTDGTACADILELIPLTVTKRGIIQLLYSSIMKGRDKIDYDTLHVALVLISDMVVNIDYTIRDKFHVQHCAHLLSQTLPAPSQNIATCFGHLYLKCVN